MFDGVEAAGVDVWSVDFYEVAGAVMEADGFEDDGEEEELVEVGVVHF